jgi:hypothetical protein
VIGLELGENAPPGAFREFPLGPGLAALVDRECQEDGGDDSDRLDQDLRQLGAQSQAGVGAGPAPWSFRRFHSPGF